MTNEELGKQIHQKTQLLNTVLDNTKNAFELMRHSAKDILDYMHKEYPKEFVFTNKNEREFEIRFGSDILIFIMHTNVFEFSRYHEVMKTPYVTQDKERSFCGMINIYNFLTDSFDYDRDFDLGYLIGRVFINKENHYFIEGKREVGMLYSNFNTAIINEDSVESIIKSSMEYANNFDLLTPPFDEVKAITVGEIKSTVASRNNITAKRLGFEFQQDKE
ncbi:MAG: hypothetical protein IJ213_00175 [Bacteroidales bacterium]|nr:hypothetical protein [Bacteroidales bacterium]MBQ9311445.1 hypothetical protein [Bacteroidales bacterium]